MAKKTVTVLPQNPVIMMDDNHGLIADQDANGKLKLLGSFTLDDLSEILSKEKPMESGYIPEQIRYFNILPSNSSYYSNIFTYIVEFKPQKYTVQFKTYDEDSDDYETRFYDLMLPYVYLKVTIANDNERTVKSTKLFVSPTPIKDFKKERVCYFPFSNVSRTFSICWGEFPSIDKKCSPAEYAVKLLNEFFKMPFNQDYFVPDNIPAKVEQLALPDAYNKQDIDSSTVEYYYLRWQYLSETNPEEVLKMTYRQAGEYLL